ncbi:putative PilZ domain-containing protein [Candidatus Magnetomoraceae bacterium gMMP-15]
MKNSLTKKIKKVFVNEQNEATVVCPKCGKIRNVKGPIIEQGNKIVKVKCPCKNVFYISFEKRQNHRKKTNLNGSYKPIDADLYEFMMVKDISVTGIRFKRPELKTMNQYSINQEDVIKVAFELDNANKDRISRTAIVKFVSTNIIGAEFTKDINYDKVLGFYMIS